MSDEEIRERNMATVREYVDALNAWDFDRMKQLMHEDCSIEFLFPAPGMPQKIEGREPVIEYMQPFADQVNSENMQVIELDTRHSDPNVVLMTARSDFDFKEPGLTYSNDYISFFRVEGGLLRGFQENFDSVRLVEGFGGSVTSPF